MERRCGPARVIPRRSFTAANLGTKAGKLPATSLPVLVPPIAAIIARWCASHPGEPPPSEADKILTIVRTLAPQMTKPPCRARPIASPFGALIRDC